MVDHTMAMKMAMPQSLQDLEAKDPKNGLPMGHAKNKTGLGEKACFSNDKGLGSAFPDVSQAVLLKGEAPDFDAGPVVLLFWAKYAKGDYRTMVHFSYLVRTIPGLQVYGISCDAEEADATAMLKKMGTAMPTQSLDELLFDYTLAYVLLLPPLVQPLLLPLLPPLLLLPLLLLPPPRLLPPPLSLSRPQLTPPLLSTPLPGTTPAPQ